MCMFSYTYRDIERYSFLNLQRNSNTTAQDQTNQFSGGKIGSYYPFISIFHSFLKKISFSCLEFLQIFFPSSSKSIRNSITSQENFLRVGTVPLCHHSHFMLSPVKELMFSQEVTYFSIIKMTSS